MSALRTPPRPFDPARAARAREAALSAASDPAALRALLADPAGLALADAASGNSPFLARLVARDADAFAAVLRDGPDAVLAAARSRLDSAWRLSRDDAMAALRIAKRHGALAIALADLSGAWDVMRVTQALSGLAEDALRCSVRQALHEAAVKGDWTGDADPPDLGCGIAVIGMGKLGARELNYSSDVDIVVVYEPARLTLAPALTPAKFCVRLTQAVVRLMQEVTADGYVFRTDLRLRPDAGATQAALSMEAAELYYETMGQNWERAAMIKARALAGDVAAGEVFLSRLQPFVFRKYLDFAAIEDIHSIKRQIHAHGGHGAIAVNGHNIKLGRGGIREIEFFAQTQQLIMGGRDAGLRARETLATLDALTERGLIAPAVRDELSAAYRYFRTLEHRLQMVDDEQTHSLPKTDDGLAHIACFMGYENPGAFAADLRGHLERVQAHYAALFESAPPLGEAEGALVFTGVESDPETVETLRRMGFREPESVADTIRGWHHGRIRATRSERARERLTALMPALLRALADTPDPQLAFTRFDRFLSGLPGGVQVFALLLANPQLLALLAEALGVAPRLADFLGRQPQVLDALLSPAYLSELPDAPARARTLRSALDDAHGYEDALDAARRWQHEQHFRIGLQLLRGTLAPDAAGAAFAALAETTIAGLLALVEGEIASAHGRVPGGACAVLGLGKLGGREMTAASDLDLVLVYDHAPDAAGSDGARSLAPAPYYARLTQRFVAALTVLTGEGKLYEVDLRLRPSGSKGPVAVRLDSFAAYHASESWTWERMALTRARVVAGDAALSTRVDAVAAQAVARPAPWPAVSADIRAMRDKLVQAYPSADAWELKHVRGGIIDLEFVAQGLQLKGGGRVRDGNTRAALAKLAAAGLLPAEAARDLGHAAALHEAMAQILRMAVDGPFVAADAPAALQALLVRSGGAADFAALDAALRDAQTRTRRWFDALLG